MIGLCRRHASSAASLPKASTVAITEEFDVPKYTVRSDEIHASVFVFLL